MAKPPVVERPYETLFICPVDTPQKTVDAFIEKVKSTITQEKGTFRSLQVWGRRRMTYPIKRQKDGIYIYFDFNGGSKSTTALDTLFHVTDFVLRHMTVLREDGPAPVPAAATVTEGQAIAAVAPEAAAPAAAPQAAAQTSPSGTGPSVK